MLACTLSLTVCPPAGVSAGAIFRPVVGLMWTPTKDMKLINPALGCLGIHSNTRAVSGRGFSFFRTGRRAWETSVRHWEEIYPTWLTAYYCLSVHHQANAIWELHLAHHLFLFLWHNAVTWFPVSRGMHPVQPICRMFSWGQESEAAWFQLGSFLGEVTTMQGQMPSSASLKPNMAHTPPLQFWNPQSSENQRLYFS